MSKKTEKNNTQPASKMSKTRNKSAERARLALIILMVMNYLLVSYIGLIWIGMGSGEGAFGFREWISLIILVLLLGSMILSFVKPLHSYAYFFLEIAVIILFWILGGDFQIPVFFLAALLIVAIPYLVFLRTQTGEWTKSR